MLLASLAASVVVLSALLWLGGRWRHLERVDRIPKPPAGAQSPAVAEHLRSRYGSAARDPTSIDTIGPLCLAYHADMFYEQADACYALAIEFGRGEWRWTYHRALIQSERGGGGSLVESLREVTERAPRFGPAWLRLGEAEFKAGRYDAAAEVWRRVTALEEPPPSGEKPPHLPEVPHSAYAEFGLARVAMVQNDPPRARDILERLTRTVPQFGSAFRLLADSYRALGRSSDADRAVYRAGRLPPYAPFADPMVDDLARESRNSTFLLRVASEANLSLNAEWSEFLTRRALEFDPDNPDVVVKLGRILRTVGRNEEALTYFLRYHQMVPGDYQGLAHIGSCLSALGRYADAESYFRRALSGVDDPVTHYNLGLLLALTGRLSAAAESYEAALARDPMHSDARTNLAAVLARQGRLDQAGRELMRVVEHDPENAAARTNLGIVLLQQGSPAQARRHLEEAVRIDPTLGPAVEALASIENPAAR
jgi:tetratricopeptide (TPR) repeat protein